MLLPRRQITRRKLCFYYTCKFGVISIKYVIKHDTTSGDLLILFPVSRRVKITFTFPGNVRILCLYCNVM